MAARTQAEIQDRARERLARTGLGRLPLRRESLADQVHERLRRSLMRGEFLPEQPVSIRSLAETMGVSAMPVREALTRLVAEGALVTQANRAIRLPPLTREALAEITMIRLALEGLAAERAARAITRVERARLARLLEALQAAADRGAIDDYLVQNARFHSGVYRAARMELLMAMIEQLWLRVGPSIRLCMPDAAHLAKSMQAHRRVLAALEAGDAAAARAAVAEDITVAAADMDRRLASREG